MTRFMRMIGTPVLALAAAVLAACGGGGGGGGQQTRTGLLTVGITDAAVDVADAVVVQFTGVELKPKDGQAFSVNFPAAKTIDLLQLQGTNRAELLDRENVPAGEYEWMRLKVNADPNVAGDSYITIGGADCELRIPSGAETGLKMIRGFTVGIGTITDFTVDFDLRKSVVQPPGQHTSVPVCDGQAYLLKPVLRVVDNLQVGTITGTVDPTLVAQKCPANEYGNVYLFGPYTADPAPVPDDVDTNDATNPPVDGPNPITTAMVGTDGTYTIGFVPAGNYIAAYTCSADNPETDEVLEFTAPVQAPPVTVTANATTAIDFAVPTP